MASILKIKREEIVGTIPPPPGVIPNFEHPESIAYRLVIVTAIFLPLATLILSLRIYTRSIIVRNIGFDDYIIILGWFLLVAYAVSNIFLIKDGLETHLWDVPLAIFSPRFLKIGVISGLFYGLSFMCVKLSILLLYLRLSPYRLFRITVYVVMVVVIMYSVLGSFEFLFNCRPIAKNWDVTISDGSCISADGGVKILLTHGAVNIVTDIATLLLPIALVRKLHLPMRQKVAIAGLFLSGSLVCIVSIIRIKSIINVVKSADITWTGCVLYEWSVVEVCFGMICACLPNFKPFLRRHFPKVLGSSVASGAITSHASRHASRRTHHALANTSIGGHELEPSQQHWKSAACLAMPRKSKQQVGTGTDNESQKDIFGDGYPKDVLRTTNATATSSVTGPPSKTGSVRFNNSGIMSMSREES